MTRDWGIPVTNTVDLSTLARKLDPYWDEEDRKKAELIASTSQNQHPHYPKGTPVGLARLAARYLALELVKRKKISRSNWENPLTTAQLDCTSLKTTYPCSRPSRCRK